MPLLLPHTSTLSQLLFIPVGSTPHRLLAPSFIHQLVCPQINSDLHPALLIRDCVSLSQAHASMNTSSPSHLIPTLTIGLTFAETLGSSLSSQTAPIPWVPSSHTYSHSPATGQSPTAYFRCWVPPVPEEKSACSWTHASIISYLSLPSLAEIGQIGLTHCSLYRLSSCPTWRSASRRYRTMSCLVTGSEPCAACNNDHNSWHLVSSSTV